MLDVRRMRILREVFRQGSMSGAARALSYTPSAISQQISILERELGVSVLRRDGRRLELTTAGRLIVEEADVILARLEALEQKIGAADAGDEGRLRLGSFLTASATIVPHIIQQFQHRCPDVALTLLEGEPEECLPMVRRGQLDVALSLEYDFVASLPMDGLERVLLFNDPMYVALPGFHPLCSESEVRVEQLAAEAWIVEIPSSSTHPFTLRACQHAGFDPRVAFEAGDYDVVQALVAVGVGVALIPELALGSLHSGVEARPVAGTAPSRRLFAAYRLGSDALLSIATMLEIMREVARVYQRNRTRGRREQTRIRHAGAAQAG
jgi:DNA-binding transcriptional LysR family regulator